MKLFAMASGVLTSFLEGQGFDGCAPDEPADSERCSDLSRSNRSGSKRKDKDQPKAGAKKRAKKDEVVMLSTSYTCWRKVPVTRLVNLATFVTLHIPGVTLLTLVTLID